MVFWINSHAQVTKGALCVLVLACFLWWHTLWGMVYIRSVCRTLWLPEICHVPYLLLICLACKCHPTVLHREETVQWTQCNPTEKSDSSHELWDALLLIQTIQLIFHTQQNKSPTYTDWKKNANSYWLNNHSEF